MKTTQEQRQRLKAHFGTEESAITMLVDDLDEVRNLVSDLFNAPVGSESVDSEEYSNALEALRLWDENAT